MSATLLFSQLLNGVQLGVLLFLMAAGLTLVFGIMNFVNLAHGSLYMIGAYVAAALLAQGVPFVFAGLGAIAATMALGFALERVALAKLYARDHQGSRRIALLHGR